MRILVIGAGSIGFQLSKQLSQNGYDITLLDIDPQRIEHVQEQLDIMAIAGNATNFSTLKNAQIQDIDLVAAMTTIDEVNLLTCQMAKKAGAGKTIARVRNSELTSPDFILSPEELGVDLMIHPEQETARAIGHLIQQSSATDIICLSEGELHLIGLRLKPRSPLLGIPLMALRQQHADIPMCIVAIKRKQQTLIPNGSDALLSDDQIFIITKADYISAVNQLTGQKPPPTNNIMILGGGLIGQFVATDIAHEKKVKLIESQQEKSVEIAQHLEHALIIHGDGTDYDLLISENLMDMGAYIAVTGNDETNIISTLIARHLGVPRTITLVNKVDYIPITPTIGLDSVVSKQLLTVNAVHGYIQHQKVAPIANLPGLDVEIIEYAIQPNSKISHEPLKKARLPKNTIIGAVIRQDRIIIPNGETHIQSEDKVVVFTHSHHKKEIDRFFS